jgi:hypothetical protein
LLDDLCCLCKKMLNSSNIHKNLYLGDNQDKNCIFYVGGAYLEES